VQRRQDLRHAGPEGATRNRRLRASTLGLAYTRKRGEAGANHKNYILWTTNHGKREARLYSRNIFTSSTRFKRKNLSKIVNALKVLIQGKGYQRGYANHGLLRKCTRRPMAKQTLANRERSKRPTGTQQSRLEYGEKEARNALVNEGAEDAPRFPHM